MVLNRSGCGAVRVAHLNGVQGVAGSNPVIPTIFLPRQFLELKALFIIS